MYGKLPHRLWSVIMATMIGAFGLHEVGVLALSSPRSPAPAPSAQVALAHRTPSLPIGIPAIRPRASSGTNAAVGPTFTVGDVIQFIKTHPMPHNLDGTEEDPSNFQVELVPAAQVSREL